MAAGHVYAPSAVDAAVFNVSDVAGFQAALDTAETNGEGDTVNVAAGTYNVVTTLAYSSSEDHPISIVGAGSGSTIMDGGSAVRVLNVLVPGQNNAHISISGLTIQNGYAEFIGGGGLWASSGGNVTVENCVFAGSDTQGNGGGAFIGSSTGTAAVRNTAFNNNGFDANEGGALYVQAGVTRIEDCVFESNSADSRGGGVSILSFVQNGQTTVTRNSFLNNESRGNAIGGGLDLNVSGTTTVSGNTFSGNTAVTVPLVEAQGAAARLEVSGTLTVSDNIIVGNLRTGGGFGTAGIDVLSFGGDITVVNNVLANNEGGAAANVETLLGTPISTMTFTNNTFTMNDRGLDMRIAQDAEVANLYNNIAWGNTGSDISVFDDGNLNGVSSLVNFFNNDFSIGGVAPGNNLNEGGNIDAEPLFADAANDDVHLLPGSPAINAGLNSAPGLPAMDFEGDDRILGGTVDMGADEVAGGGTTDPVPDVKVNGSDGPITIGTGDSLAVAVSLVAGSQAGTGADWWLVASTSFGVYHYDFVSSRWMPGLVVTFQGPLADVGPLALPARSGLPPGDYVIHFGVDLVSNGQLDPGQAFSDSADVTVTP
jgi:hypothetical protein